MEYNDIKVGKIYTIEKGTEFFSLYLGEQITLSRDAKIRVHYLCVPEEEIVYGNLMENQNLLSNMFNLDFEGESNHDVIIPAYKLVEK